jgi:hypothetical protein
MIIVSPPDIPLHLHGHRAALGIGRKDFAEQLAAATGREPKGVTAQLWSWETGKIAPSLSNLVAWLDALGLALAIVPAPAPPACTCAEPSGQSGCEFYDGGRDEVADDAPMDIFQAHPEQYGAPRPILNTNTSQS